jgi:hypothetical protein
MLLPSLLVVCHKGEEFSKLRFRISKCTRLISGGADLGAFFTRPPSRVDTGFRQAPAALDRFKIYASKSILPAF